MPIIPGTSGNDDIIGTAIEDTITAGAGDDLINGGAGDDVIYGDSGNSLSAGGSGVPGDTLGDGPGSTGGYDGGRTYGQSVYNGNHSFSTDAFYLGNDIPVLDDANRDALTGVSFSQDGEGTDRTFGLDELEFTGAQRSFVGLVTVQDSDVHNANDQFSSSLSGGFQDTTVVSSGTADFTMNDGQVFQGIRVNYVRGPDGETYMMPDDGPSPSAFNSFRNLLETNDSGIASFTIATGSGDDAGINPIEGNWADGQFFEPGEGDGGDDTMIGGEGADTMFGEGGDDTFIVGSAAEGAGDVISGGFGPDDTTDNDVLDLRGAGTVSIDATADANDAGAQAGTVTFADGSTLEFEGIETILEGPAGPGPNAIVDGEDFAEDMGIGYNDAGQTTDGGGDIIDGADGDNDVIEGNGGDDTITAGAGDDTVDGGSDDDLIYGDFGGAVEPVPGNPTTLDISDLSGGRIVSEDGALTADVSLGGFVQTTSSTTGNAATPENVFYSGPEFGGSSNALELDFDTPVSDVSFTLFDVNQGGGWDDQVRIIALDADGNEVPVTFSGTNVSNGGVDVRGNTIDANDNDTTFRLDGNNPDNVQVQIEGPISSVRVIHEPGNDSSSAIGFIGVGDIDVTPLLSDPTGGNPSADDEGDDLLDGGIGEDTIFGEGGNDTIDGGADNDVIYGDSGVENTPSEPSVEIEVPSEGGVATLLVWDVSQLSYSGGNPFPNSTTGLSDSSVNGITMTIGDDQTPVAVGVDDGSSSHFNDGDLSQDTVNNEFIDGTSISANSTIIPEYSYNVRNVDTGEVIEVYAVEVGSNNVIGFVSDTPMEQGATYEFFDRTDTTPSVDYDDLATTYIDPDGGVVAPAEGGDDVITGGAGADQMFGEGGDDTFLVGSAAEGAGDVIDGGNGPDETTDLDVLDLRGAGQVTIDDAADANDAGATAGTVTFEDGSTLAFEGIEEILQDPADVAPDANDDTATLDEDAAPISIDVLANDIDPNGDPLTVVDATVPEDQGTVAVIDNEVVFTPAPDFNGEATITYTVEDPAGNQDTAEVAVTVAPVNDAPVAEDDTATTPEDTPVTIDVLDNDDDVDGDPLTVVEATAPNGTVTINPDGTLEYTPDPDFNGEDTITYTVEDPSGETSTAQVSVNITPVDDAPVANDDTATLDEDAAPITINVLANDTDPQGDPLTVVDATVPADQGSVAVIGNQVVFTPAPDFNGDATITYTIEDPDGNQDTAEVAVTVTPVEDAPVTEDDTAATDEDTPVTIDPLANDSDPDGQPLAIAGIPTSPNGTVTVNPDNTIEFTPDPDFNGPTTIDYIAVDPDGNETPGQIIVDVAPVVDPDGVVDGLDDGELMNPGYTDPEGDEIDGDDGLDDVIDGNGGDDTINAGLGDDTVSGGDNDDLIDGEEGDDVLTGNEGMDTIDGGDGNDDIDGGDDDDVLAGNEGMDTIDGGLGDDDIDGGDDDDVLAGNEGQDTIDGEAGDDTLDGGDDADVLTGGEGDDVLNGDDGDDDIAVGGADTANGGLGDDVFTVDPTDLNPDVDATIDGGSDGTTGDPAGPENGDEGDILDLSDQLGDLEVVLQPNPESGTVDGLDADGTPDITFDEIEIIETGLGDDLIDGTDAEGPVDAAGNEGEDTLLGGAGDDTLDGGDDDDLLDGGDGDDSLVGGDGTDTLTGGEGADTLDGGLDDDDLFVGAGDTALGGAGDDEFYVDPALTGSDDITVIGGEESEDLSDPANGGDGDTLDLRGLGEVEIVYNEDDPTFDPATGVSESGTATYTNDAGDPVTINFSEIEDVLADVIDQSPIANDDTADVTEDTPTTIDVLGNDTDPNGDPLTVTEATAPNGTVTINPDGTLEYTPDPDFNGEDTITYTVEDPDGNTATGEVAVSVAPVNDAPVAEDDAAETDAETPVTIDVLGNDTDEENDPLTVVDAEAENGIVDINPDGTLEYTPDAGFDGVDTITYTISDGELTDTAEVAVTVAPVEDVTPVANPDTAEVDEGTVATIDVLSNDTDPQGDPLTVVDADAPNGIVDINPDGTLSYEPDEGFIGEDTITYTIQDPDGNQSTSTVTVTVNEVPVGNSDPVATDDVYEFDLEGYEGGNIRLTGSDDRLLANDTDADGDALRVAEGNDDPNLRQWFAADNGGEIRITSSGAVRFRDVDGDFADLPDGQVQATSITYTVSDGQGGFDEATITVNVTGAALVEDQTPDAVDDTASVDAGNFVTIPVLANDTDPQGDPLTVTFADAPNGIVDINPDGTITYEPDEGFIGEDTITYTVTDPDGNTDTAEVTVAVNEGETTPIVVDDTADVDEDDIVTIDVLANDTDPNDDPLTVVEATAPNGTVTINPDGTLEYTPDPDFNGEDTITYTVEDPDGNTATGEVAVSVAPVNDAPVAEDDAAETDAETPVTIDVLGNDTDEENDPLTVVDAEAENGIVDINPDGTLEYTPDAGFDGVDTITYTISDGELTDTAEVAVTVNLGDQPPVANDDTADVDEDSPVIIDVLGNDTDPNGDPLTVVEATAPNGTVTINPDGTLEYTPDPDFNGEDTITYTIEDPAGNAATGEVAVSVAPVNDAPVAEDDTSATIGETPVTIDVLANDTDVDGDLLTVVDAEAENGIVDINPDGTLEYTADAGFDGVDTITYTISDGTLTDTATVAVTVGQGDLPPVVVDDTADVDEDGSVNIDVLANDSDPNGDPLTVVDATAPNGTVTINPDGTLDYTPDPDFNGEDTITYTVEDPAGNAASGTVAVTIAPVNDAPVANDDTGATEFETSVTLDVLDNDTDVDGDLLTVTEAMANNGTVTINPDGTLEYTPDAGFEGTDTISYTISDGSLTDTAHVDVEVAPDNTGGAGPVDGLDTGETMNPGYTDADGDQIDGDDGLNDEIFGNGGDDRINAGEGNDTIDGGEGNDNINAGNGDDVIIRSNGGFEQMDGGAGDDTLTGNGEGDMRVHVNGNGDGDVFHADTGSFGLFDSIENFTADEIEGENDKIVFTDSIAASRINEDINGVSDSAFGNFYPEGTSNVINFGPDTDYLLSDILSGTAPASGQEAVGPVGEFIIFGGDEDGEIDGISYENFELVQFDVEADPDFMSLMRSPEEEARIAEGAAVIEEEEEEDLVEII